MVRSSLLAGAAAVAVLSGIAHADGFALSDFSAADFGRANAGRVVFTDDAGVAFANPAMMALFERRVATVQLSAIMPRGEYTDGGSADVLTAPLGSGTDEVFATALVPSAYLVWPVSEALAFGLAVNTPFGLSTDYPSDWAGRYQALTSDLKTINVNPSLSYRVSNAVSVGLGLNLQYAEAILSNAIDFGAVCLGALDATSCAGLGLLPQAADGEVEVTGDDVSFGYNLGLGVFLSENVRVGLSYRSAIEHEIEGSAVFDVPAAAVPLTATGGFSDTDAAAALTLPASAEVGIRARVSDRVAVYGTAQWMDWSEIANITVIFDNPAQPPSAEILSYDDAYRYGVGADFMVREGLTLRAGVALDTIPTDGPLPSARIPDGERVVYAAGASWNCGENIAINAAFSYIAMEDARIDRVGTFGERLRGEYESNVPVLSVNISRAF